jgi:F-type H+-transporting ATPase subunit b
MADAAARAVENGTSGLPQFDIGQWPGEMIWMLIIFAVMYVLFSRVFVPKIGGTIAEREDTIGGDIKEARRLRDEAEAQAKAAADEVAQARAEAMSQVRGIAADAAEAIVARLTGEAAAPAEVERALASVS